MTEAAGSQDAIKVEGLSKTFKLPHERTSSIKSSVVHFRRREKGYELQEALKDISFEIKKGEFFGIVGRNGSGKSTLLKLLAGIYAPDKGDINIKGSLVPFIELGVGFNPELTGRENVYLNGSLLGFNRKEMQAMYKDIVDFAELKRFMDQKLKNYSSGMQVRLAFSIAIRARGDILLLDEVLAVGDAAFQQKCYDYFNALKREKRTIILVSHSMQIVEQYCDRALLLEQGVIKHMGSSGEIAAMYENMFQKEEVERIRSERKKLFNEDLSEEDDIKIHKVQVSQGGKPVSSVESDIDFDISITIESREGLKSANIGLNIKNRDRVMLVNTDSKSGAGGITLNKGTKKTVTFRIQNILTKGIYLINLGIADNSNDPPRMIKRIENAKEFTVEGEKSRAVANPTIEVSIK